MVLTFSITNRHKTKTPTMEQKKKKLKLKDNFKRSTGFVTFSQESHV